MGVVPWPDDEMASVFLVGHWPPVDCAETLLLAVNGKLSASSDITLCHRAVTTYRIFRHLIILVKQLFGGIVVCGLFYFLDFRVLIFEQLPKVAFCDKQKSTPIGSAQNVNAKLGEPLSYLPLYLVLCSTT